MAPSTSTPTAATSAAPTPQPTAAASAKRECPITVAVRIRPPPEAYALSHQCVQPSPHDPTHQVIVNFDAFADASAAASSAPPRAFTFDHVFSPQASQVDVYTTVVRPLLDQVVLGFNVTALVYGQTGSGKTYTMGTCPLSQMASAEEAAPLDAEQDTDDEIPAMVGIAPRLVEELIQRLPDVNQRLLRVSYIELYQEEVRDLLASDATQPVADPYSATFPSSSTSTSATTPITIREDRNGTILLSGVSSLPCTTSTDILTLLDRGSQARTTGETNMNLTSSRSHAIFSIFIEQYILNPATRQVECRESKLHLVDLAGSERQKRTLADGVRFKESIKINSGLLALGNVINALSAGTTQHTGHVPYRDSKLTRLLQDSLGGNSKTVLIACVSPVPGNAQESLNTLVYAHRAKRIKNRPVVNIASPPAVAAAASTDSGIVAAALPMVGMEERAPPPAVAGLGQESAAELLALVEQLKSGLTQANGMIAELHAKTALVPAPTLQPSPTTMNQLPSASPGSEAAQHLALEVAKYLQSPHPDPSRLTHLLATYGVQLPLASPQMPRSTSTLLDSLPPLPAPGRSASVTSLARKPSSSGGAPPLRALSSCTSSSSSPTLRRATTAPATSSESTHSLLARVADLESQLSAQALDLERVRVQARDARAAADVKSAELDRVERRTKDAQDAAGYWERKANETCEELAEVRAEAVRLQEEREHMKRNVRELEDELVALRSSREQVVAPGLEDELVRLTSEMEEKLKMIEELDASRKRTDHLSQKYVDKMVKLERELQAAEKQVDRLKSEKLEMDSEKNRLKHEYEIKIQQVSAQLNALRGRQKQHDKLVREKESKQRQIADLQSEVDKLRDRHAQLKSKSRAEADKLASVEAVHLAAVQKLERQHDEDVRRIKVLEGQVVALRKRVDSAASVSSASSSAGAKSSGNDGQGGSERVAELEAEVVRMKQERDKFEERVRDLEHYRTSNKELRMQLRALMATAAHAAHAEESGLQHHHHQHPHRRHRHGSKDERPTDEILAAAIVPLSSQEAHSRSASEAAGGTPTSGARVRVSKKHLKLMAAGMSAISVAAASDQYEMPVPAGMETQMMEERPQMVGL